MLWSALDDMDVQYHLTRAWNLYQHNSYAVFDVAEEARYVLAELTNVKCQHILSSCTS